MIPRLQYSADLRSLFFLGLTLTLLSLHFSRVISSGWIYLLTCPLAFICCIIAHNHMHAGTFVRKGWNNTLSVFIMFGSGQPPTGIITAHNERHHQGMESEQDFVKTSLVRSSNNLLNVILFPFFSVAKMYREKPSDLKSWRKRRPKLYRQALLERAIFYSVMLVLLVIDWKQTLLTFAIPWVFGQYCLIAINLLQHQDCDHASDWNHSRNLTGKTGNWFLLNNGFHTAHHLKPSMHWSLLPAYHKKHIEAHMDPSLNHKSLCHLIWCRINRPPRHA
ncbi:fatty acid desaturase [Oceaniferula spumae]|uniref:Fatty acid desaturase n=1 Tax=Oceaniferula spumae TaxID=2979115 RepID=A0AAT9FJP2_9BACT